MYTCKCTYITLTCTVPAITFVYTYLSNYLFIFKRQPITGWHRRTSSTWWLSLSWPLVCMFARMFAHVSACVYVCKSDYLLILRVNPFHVGKAEHRPRGACKYVRIRLSMSLSMYLKRQPTTGWHRGTTSTWCMLCCMYAHVSTCVYTYLSDNLCTLRDIPSQDVKEERCTRGAWHFGLYVYAHVSTCVYIYQSCYLFVLRDNPFHGGTAEHLLCGACHLCKQPLINMLISRKRPAW